MPNMTVNNIQWTRVCPKAIDLQFTIGRDDGLYPGSFPNSQYVNRYCEITWILNGPISYTAKLNSFETWGMANDLVTVRINDVPAGDYTLWAYLDIVERDSSDNVIAHDGPCGVGDGGRSFTVTNVVPSVAQQASITSFTERQLNIQLDGNISDECPAYCTTVVNGSVYGLDDNMLPTTAPMSLGSQNGPYSQTWTLSPSNVNITQADNTTQLCIEFDGVTTDPWGLASSPAVSKVIIAMPADGKFTGIN